jgi:small subunit ribosomal protein S21
MPIVRQNSNEPVESLLRRFNREVSKAGTLGFVRRRRWHIAKSELRRMEKKRAVRRMRRRPPQDGSSTR